MDFQALTAYCTYSQKAKIVSCDQVLNMLREAERRRADLLPLTRGGQWYAGTAGREVKDIEKENNRFKKLLADISLDGAILRACPGDVS